MKTLVLEDIYGRLHWFDIIEKEQPDILQLPSYRR